jgi:hypothetical protein
LNSGVNERRGRGFFLAMGSMMGILSGPKPQMLDVRHGGSTPEFLAALAVPQRCFPADSLLPGDNPAHDARCAAVGNFI